MATRRAKPKTSTPQQYPPAILLMGPTASGKTGVAVELLRELPCEIISVDSAQVYRHMDIGTAKPDAEMLKAAPHHLIDVIEPDEIFSAARFRDDAQALMREITERGNIPLLVGGTMMYFKTLLEGLSELPQADPGIRMVIDSRADESGWPALHQELKRVDPKTAARLAPNDSQRIQRALEVFYITNRPMSELLQKPKYVYFPYTPLKIGLLPSDRAELHDRIAARFEAMLELGLIGELRKLREDYSLEPSMPSMRGTGSVSVCDEIAASRGLSRMNRRIASWWSTWPRGGNSVLIQRSPKFRFKIASTEVPAFLNR